MNLNSKVLFPIPRKVHFRTIKINLYFTLGIFNEISTAEAEWKQFTEHDTYMDFLKGWCVIRMLSSFWILLKNIPEKSNELIPVPL